MDMHWLDDVLILLEERNLTRAAARRNITQPAFSRRIRSFEDWLGVDVLDRQKNRVTLTPALMSSEAEIRALANRLRDLRTKIAHHEPQSSTLSIAAQHAPVFSTFPDMALRAKSHFPALKFRLRAGNLRDCVTLFLRGDTDMLLCYESGAAGAMPFDASIRRALWGRDYLVPVVGGKLRFAVKDNGDVPPDTPAIIYPESSHFGEILQQATCAFSTQSTAQNPVCETAFSSGIKELALKGIGIGWLPFSMVPREIENGSLISLANSYGRVPLDVAIYADVQNQMALSLLEVWAQS